MNRNRILLILVLVLAAVAAFIVINRSKSTFSNALSEFAIDDTTTVTRIFLADKENNKVNLSRELGGAWKLNDTFSVRPDAINILLKTIQDIDVSGPVPRSGHNNVIKKLASSSVKIEIYQWKHRIQLFGKIKLFPRETLVKTYYVGSNTQDNLGTYMLLEGSDVPFVVYIPGFKGFVSVRYTARPEDWRDHTVFNHRIADIQKIRIDFNETPFSSFEISNQDDRIFKLKSVATNTEIPVYDTLRLLDFLASFYSIKFEALLPNLKKEFVDSIRSSKPFHTITLTEKSGKVLKVNTFHRKNPTGPIDENGNMIIYDRDRMYASLNDDKDFVLIQFFVFDNILRPLELFLASPKPGR